jgi:hypothetical protein
MKMMRTMLLWSLTIECHKTKSTIDVSKYVRVSSRMRLCFEHEVQSKGYEGR